MVLNTYFRVRVPRAVAMVITSLQLLQMVVGCFVNYTAFTFKLKGETCVTVFIETICDSGMKCGVSETNLKLSLLMYSSYFVLFAKFFHGAYMGSGAGGKKGGKGEEIIMENIGKLDENINRLQREGCANISSGVSSKLIKNKLNSDQPPKLNHNHVEKESVNSKPHSFESKTNKRFHEISVD